MTSVQQKVSAGLDRVIAAGDATSGKLKVTGTVVAIGTGIVTVPAGTVGGAAAGAIKGFVKGETIVNNDRTIQAARVVGGATTVLAGIAAVAGVAVPGLGPITIPAALVLGATGAGLTIAGAGVVNGVAAAFDGAVDGGKKGYKVGVAAAKATGGVAQEVADDAVKAIKKVAKDAVRAAGIVVHNGAEATREGYEELSVKEADAAQAVADALKEKANAVANGGPRYDANGKKLADFPPDYKKI